MEEKQIIINLFNLNVKGKEININNKNHKGCEGYWLEKQMGIKHNSRCEPDLYGYEMKKHAIKITFGDISANEYLFSKNKKIIDNNIYINRNDFIRYFGTPNPLKNNRYSWSGKCVPKYDTWNSSGQIIIFNDNLDLIIYYDYEKDNRDNKKLLPDFLKKNKIIIAIWYKEKLKEKIENKFNNKGFFICKKINNIYEKISFGNPFNYNYFVDNFKEGNIIFDSGMYENNSRNYSNFRSLSSNFWDKLIIEEY